MKDFLPIILRFLPPYKKWLLLNFLFNLLSGLFAVFSVAMMIPMLEIILQQGKEVLELSPWELNFAVLKSNLYYYITILKIEYGPGWSLLFVGLFLAVGTLLKVGTAYLASVSTIIIRNGVVRDLRHQIYDKIIKLAIGFFSDERKGDIIARSTGDVQEVENSIMSSLDMFLKNPVLIIVYITTMMILSIKLTIFAIIILPIAAFIVGVIGKNLKRQSRKGQRSEERRVRK